MPEAYKEPMTCNIQTTSIFCTDCGYITRNRHGAYNCAMYNDRLRICRDYHTDNPVKCQACIGIGVHKP